MTNRQSTLGISIGNIGFLEARCQLFIIYFKIYSESAWEERERYLIAFSDVQVAGIHLVLSEICNDLRLWGSKFVWITANFLI